VNSYLFYDSLSISKFFLAHWEKFIALSFRNVNKWQYGFFAIESSGEPREQSFENENET
jgi:hypothetical protein